MTWENFGGTWTPDSSKSGLEFGLTSKLSCNLYDNILYRKNSNPSLNHSRNYVINYKGWIGLIHSVKEAGRDPVSRIAKDHMCQKNWNICCVYECSIMIARRISKPFINLHPCPNYTAGVGLRRYNRSIIQRQNNTRTGARGSSMIVPGPRLVSSPSSSLPWLLMLIMIWARLSSFCFFLPPCCWDSAVV